MDSSMKKGGYRQKSDESVSNGSMASEVERWRSKLDNDVRKSALRSQEQMYC